MQIAYVIGQYTPANLLGSHIYIKNFAQQMSQRKHKVTILTSTECDSDQLRPLKKVERINDIEVRRFKIIRYEKLRIANKIRLEQNESDSSNKRGLETKRTSSYFYGIKEILFNLYTGQFVSLWSPALYLHILKSSYDLIHVTPFPCTHTWLASRAAWKAKVPLIITPAFHFEMSSIYNKHLGTLLAYADAVFSNTNIEKRKIIELGINPEKIYVIPPGIDVSKWESRCGDRFRKKYGLKDKFIILFAGAKSYHKGALHLLKAMQLIQQHEKNVVLVAIGYDTAEWHEEKIKLRNLNVIDLGYVSEKEKHDAFDACDLFAMPSKADSFGIVYLEAWICGKPVIGARVGAIQEVIREGVDGYMVKFGDVSDLAKKILHLSKNPDLCERLGANGKKRVLKNHNWEKIGQKISSVYESIVGRN